MRCHLLVLFAFSLYNHPGLVVDLGVGLWAWPLPVDWDKDGDLDLLVSCPDKPFNGTYFFENPDGAVMPTFKPPVRRTRDYRSTTANRACSGQGSSTPASPNAT